MPVRRYRSIEDMSRAPPHRPPNASRDLKDAFDLVAICYGLRPWKLVPGVHKFRSIEEASAARAKWEDAASRAERPGS